MGLERFLRPRQVNFIAMLADQARLTLEGLEALEGFAKTSDPRLAQRVIELEREEDELRRILIDELNRTFVTPIDREDIFALSRTVADILDYAYTTIDEMEMFELKPTRHIEELATILRQAADEIHRGIIQLKAHPSVAASHAVTAKHLENRAESIYREAIRDLFNNVTSVEDVVYALKMREVYRHLSNAADRGDEAANIIGDIVVKTT